MIEVVYVGTSDKRVLDEADFEKLETPHETVEFSRGVPVELSNKVAKALLESSLVAGEFVDAASEDEDHQAAVERAQRDAQLPDTSGLLANLGPAGVDSSGAEDSQTASGSGPATGGSGTSSGASTGSSRSTAGRSGRGAGASS